MVGKIFIDSCLEEIRKKHNIPIDKAFEVFAIATVLGKPFDDVYLDPEILIGDYDDGGIDGVHIEENRNSFLLRVFQCKNKQNLKKKDVQYFKQCVEDVFTHGNIGKPHLEKLKNIFEQFKSISRAGRYIEIKKYFIFNGDARDNEPIFTSENDPRNNFHIVDVREIERSIEKSIEESPTRNLVEFEFKAIKSNLNETQPQSLVSYALLKVKAANFRTPVIDLCKLYNLEIEKNQSSDLLFAKNIRGFLGYNKTNKKIKSTLESPDSSQYFPFLNNGITIICSEMTLPLNPQLGDYMIPVKNPLIVNGFQTTRVVYDVYKNSPESLEGVYVNVKLFETSEQSLIDKITDSTNTQSTINFKDKMSNKPFHKYTKKFFSTKNIAYSEKRGAIFLNKSLKETHANSISSDRILKFWYASFYEQPDVAKRSIAKVLETIFDATNGDHELKVLFDGRSKSPVYYQLYATYKILDHVTKKRLDDEGKFDFIEHSDEILVYGIYKEIIENGKVFSDQKISDAYKNSVKVVQEIVKQEKKIREKRGVEYAHNTYFKSSKCKIDYNNKKEYPENENLSKQLLNLDIRV